MPLLAPLPSGDNYFAFKKAPKCLYIYQKTQTQNLKGKYNSRIEKFSVILMARK